MLQMLVVLVSECAMVGDNVLVIYFIVGRYYLILFNRIMKSQEATHTDFMTFYWH